jgi:hypothetical protein
MLQLRIALLAVVTLLLLSQNNWIWTSLYLQIHNLGDIIIALFLMTLFVVCFFLASHLLVGISLTINAINLCIAVLLTYAGFIYIKALFFASTPITEFQKLALIAIATITAILFYNAKSEARVRIYSAIIVGGLIFISLPLIVATLYAKKINWPEYSASPNKEILKQNTVVLLLDELSGNAADPIIKSLKSEGLHIELNNIDTAGKNTMNVIPSIWTKKNFDQAIPCGPTYICSGTTVLDFDKVWASSSNIDIVSFFHRYCEIHGLRSCSFENLPTKSASKSLLCNFPNFKEFKNLYCNDADKEREHFESMRQNMRVKLFEAPFWEKGGILYAHLLIPHPLMGTPSKKLSEEYRDNIENGANLVKLVAQKAKSTFKDDFKIIVFSDHPLRPEIWCAQTSFLKIGCEPKESQISTQVPLIIATPTATQQPTHSVTNNKFVFDLLF